ncbi:MAG: hypothetical protein A2147_06235 [Chloroflexi bacterium RBG_16_57_8]|nr:MAG: hypothetical protein A2147_06235 [Chloroflexi bacterium RBG_16_57_8]
MAMTALELNARVAVLERNLFFQNLDIPTLRKIAMKCAPREYKRNDVIWMQGDPSNILAVIRDGYVKIVKHSEGGKDILLELLGPGDVLGAVVLLEGRPYPATALTLDRALLLELTRDDFLDIIRHNPAVATQALIATGARLRRAHEMMRELAVERVEARMANVFLMLASRLAPDSSERVVLRVRLTRRDIAEMVGTALETTIRVLSRWEKEGIVARERGKIVLIDMPAIRRLAADENPAKL